MEYRFTIIKGEVETVIDEPIGWDKCRFTLARDENYHGIFVTFSTDLDFVGTGYTIISDTFYNEGIEAVLTLRIEERCNASYDYSEVFEGRINLSRFQDLFNGYCSCKANLEDKTSQMLIKNNNEKLVNLSTELVVEDGTLPALTPNLMTMHSKAIVLTTLFKEAIELFVSINMDNVDNQAIAMPFWLLLDSDDLNSGLSSSNLYVTRNILSNPTWWVDVSQFKASYSGVYTIDYDIISQTNFKVYARDFEMNMNVAIYKNGDLHEDISNLVSREEYINVETIYSDDWNCKGTSTITLNAGDYVSIFYRIRFIWLEGVGSGVVDWQHLSTTQNVTFKSETTTASSEANTYLIYEAVERVAQATLNKIDAFDSDFLGRVDLGYGANGCGSFMAVTNGFNIRAFDKPVLFNLKDSFNSLSAVNCLGLGLENDKIKIEPLDYFYNSNLEMAQHLNIKQIAITSDEKLIYNTAVIGFEKSGTEDGTDKQNILDGFATQHNYNFPITTVKKAFTKISNWIADHYSIEFTRRVQYFTTSTQSWKYDNDNFMICTNRSVDENDIPTSLNIAEKNENFATTNNILSPETGYNLRLTPTRMLLKWNQLISGVYSKAVGNSIKFVDGISNYLYQSQLDGNCTDRYNNELLSENQNLAWDDANNGQNAPIIEPISIKYTYPMTSTEFASIVSNPIGYISASKSGTIENRGFIKMLTFTPNEGMADIELIRMFGNESQCDLVYVECPYVEPEYVD
jgi:hypothetical protein